MNRDEKRTRGPEAPPEFHSDEKTGVTTLAPIDKPSGGTWIGVNNHGVLACILNSYRAEDGRAIDGSRYRSRGTIIPQLLAMKTFEEIMSYFKSGFKFDQYSSFQLLVADSAGSMICDSHSCKIEILDKSNDWQMWTSSSWKTEEVLNWRREEFDNWVRDGAPFLHEVPAFHLLQPDELEEWSPLMSREKTCTRSITQISINYTQKTAFMRWWPDPDKALSNPSTENKLALTL